MEFRATIEQSGKSATGIHVPDEVVESLGGGKRPKVGVAIGSYWFSITLGSMGGRTMIPLSAAHRSAAGVAAGDVVEVAVELDTLERTYEVPDDLAEALAAAGLRETFDGLAPSHRKEHVRAVSEAKKPETRARRVAKAVEQVAAKRT